MMLAARRRDAACELALRRALFAMGLRFRVDQAVVPGTKRRVDITFVQAKVEVYVDDCFGHACPVHGTAPRAYKAWLRERLDANAKRDRDTDEHLRAAGWLPLRFWEHEDSSRAAEKVDGAVCRRSPNC